MRTRFCLTLIGMALLLGFMPGQAQQANTGFQPSPVKVSRTVDSVLGKAYFVHEVQKGHTLYSICKAYKIEAGQILKDSPESEVQIGEFLYIPLDESLITGMERLEKFDGKRPWAVVFYERDHQGENRYATDMGDKAKDKGKDKNRKSRRKKNKEESLTQTEETVLQADTSNIASTDVPSIEPETSRLKRKAAKDSLQISLLLPLYSDMPESRRAYIYLPYFEGASIAWIEQTDSAYFIPPVDSSLIALDSLAVPGDSLQVIRPKPMPSPIYKPRASKKQPGLKFKLYDIAQTLYASDQHSRSLHNTLNDPEFRESDVIVAGAFASQFPLIDSFSRKHQIPLMHPFSERDSMAVGNPWFMQASASSLAQIQKVASYVQNHFPDTALVIIVSDSSQTERAKAKALHQMLPGSKRYLFNPVTQILLEDLVMDTAVILVPFYQEEITAVKTFLPLRQGKGNITMIAPATWLEYSTTDVDYFLQNNLTVYSTFQADKEGPEFKEFARKYYMVYHGMPGTLAYQGYLGFRWLMDMLTEYNADFMRHIEDAEENPFQLEERPSGGFESTDIRIFKLTANGLKEMAGMQTAEQGFLEIHESPVESETEDAPVQRSESAPDFGPAQ